MKIVKKDSRLRAIVRAPRYISEITVQTKTFGSPITYKMSTVDASLSGLLILTTSPQNVPFSVNTILELTIGPQTGMIEKAISVVGKVVRRDDHMINEHEGKAYLGIKIIDIDNYNLRLWNDFMEYLKGNSKEAGYTDENGNFIRTLAVNS